MRIRQKLKLYARTIWGFCVTESLHFLADRRTSLPLNHKPLASLRGEIILFIVSLSICAIAIGNNPTQTQSESK